VTDGSGKVTFIDGRHKTDRRTRQAGQIAPKIPRHLAVMVTRRRVSAGWLARRPVDDPQTNTPRTRPDPSTARPSRNNGAKVPARSDRCGQYRCSGRSAGRDRCLVLVSPGISRMNMTVGCRGQGADQDPLGAGRGQRPRPFPLGLLRSPRGRETPASTRRSRRAASIRSLIVTRPACRTGSGNLDTAAVLTARLLPAPPMRPS
jgi:hypothetical protein